MKNDNRKFTIKGRTYDLSDAADLVSIQNALVPENWTGKKGDLVRLFLVLSDMAALQFRRHFAANFKKLAKAALEEQADGGSARIGTTFAIEIDLTSPMVAALTKIKMSFSTKTSTDGKPQTIDLTQDELPLDEGDMSEVLEPGGLDREKADAEEEEKKRKAAEKDEKAAAAKLEKFPGAPATDDGAPAGAATAAVEAPGSTTKPPRRKKRK